MMETMTSARTDQARVVLEPVTEADHAEALFAWRQSPEIKRFMYTRKPLVWESHVAWIRSLPGQVSRRDFAVCLDGKPVGSVNLTELDSDHRRASFGLYIADAAARLQGVGAAAECLILDHAFGTLQLHKVSCEVFANNPAPMAMHHRMGFQEEGRLRDHVCDDGEWIDVIRLSILEREWFERREAMTRILKRLLAPKPPRCSPEKRTSQ